MKLNVPYKMKNGDIITFDGVSMYQNEFNIPIDIYTSKQYDGQWNKEGQYLSNVYFKDRQSSPQDIEVKNNEN